MKKLIALVLALTLLFSFSACGAKTEAPEENLTKLKVAYMPNWGALWAVATAENKGYFAEEGLEIEFVQVEEGPTEVAALESEGIDVAYIGQGPHKLCSTGVAQVFLLQHLGQADFIIGLNGVSSLEDLRGKKVGYAAGTASETLLLTALTSVGMTMEDIEAVSLEAVSLTAAAISSNVDAISVWNPFAETILAEDENAVKLCTNADFPSVFAPGSWVVNPDWAKENTDTLVRFTRAMYKAMDYASAADTDDAIAEEVAGYIASVMKGDPETILSQRYDGTWLTKQDIVTGIENGELLNYYGNQQDAFLASGVLDADSVLAPSEFVLVDVMAKAAE